MINENIVIYFLEKNKQFLKGMLKSNTISHNIQFQLLILIVRFLFYSFKKKEFDYLEQGRKELKK